MCKVVIWVALAAAACTSSLRPAYPRRQMASPDLGTVVKPRERPQLPGQEEWRVEEQRRVDEQTRQARKAGGAGKGQETQETRHPGSD
jgi:hypothetical protein